MVTIQREEEIGKMLKQARLRQIRQQTIDVPFGAWDTQVGVLMERNTLASYEGLKPVLCKLLHNWPSRV